MKKLLVAAAIAGLVGTANAQSAFEGFFGQIGIGYESVNPNFTNGVTTGSGSAINFSGSNANSFTGNIAIGGYFGVTQSFLLGVGAEYAPFAGSNQNQTYSVPAFGVNETFSFKKNNSYNIYVSPAYAIDKDKLAYAKVGYTGLSTKSSFSDGVTDTTNFTGYSLGLGYKQIIDGGLYGFAEANYASYGSKTLTDTTASSKPSSMNFLVGIGYKF